MHAVEAVDLGDSPNAVQSNQFMIDSPVYPVIWVTAQLVYVFSENFKLLERWDSRISLNAI